MKKYVITISREYGSGGNDIGKRLAGLLGVPFYDREIVELTAQKNGLDAADLQEMEDKSRTPLPFGLGGMGVNPDSADRLFILQSQTIIGLAKQPCVIVGRCADFVLRDHPDRISFFIYSGMKQRLDNAKKQAEAYKNAGLREIEKMDRRRAAYYKYHTGQEWGKPSNYHLCVDSGVLGMATADALAAFLQIAGENRIKEAE